MDESKSDRATYLLINRQKMLIQMLNRNRYRENRTKHHQHDQTNKL